MVVNQDNIKEGSFLSFRYMEEGACTNSCCRDLGLKCLAEAAESLKDEDDDFDPKPLISSPTGKDDPCIIFNELYNHEKGGPRG